VVRHSPDATSEVSIRPTKQPQTSFRPSDYVARRVVSKPEDYMAYYTLGFSHCNITLAYISLFFKSYSFLQGEQEGKLLYSVICQLSFRYFKDILSLLKIVLSLFGQLK